jgi:hypothetical protein
VCRLRIPREGLIRRARAGQTQGVPDGPTAVLRYTDVRACLVSGRTGRHAERAFIAEELDDGGSIHERDAVGCSVLKPDGAEAQGAEPILLVGKCPAQVHRGVHGAVTPVVLGDAPARERRTGRPGDLDALAGIRPGVVVVDLVDPDRGRVHRERDRPPGREGGDRHGGDQGKDQGACGGAVTDGHDGSSSSSKQVPLR